MEEEIIAKYLLTMPMPDISRKWVGEYARTEEWDQAIIAAVSCFLKQGAHFPKVVLKYLDFEYFDDKDYARIRELATEDFDYEAHLDLLEH